MTPRLVLLITALILTSSVTAWSGGQIQQKVPTGATKPAVPMQKKAAAPPISVEAFDLLLTPVQPKINDTVTVKFKIKNTGTGTVAKVPWSIHHHTANATLASGDHANLHPGEIVEKTATWKATAGQHKLQGYVDPTGSALKNTAPVARQVRERDVNVRPEGVYVLRVSFGGTGTGYVTSLSNPIGGQSRAIRCGLNGYVPPALVDREGSRCSEDHSAGAAARLRAHAKSGHQFLFWTGACAGQQTNVCDLTMNDNKGAVANFGPE